MTQEQMYKKLRNDFLPEKITCVFVAESPPAGHGYIYDPSGRPSELFFRSMMRVLFQKDFDSKQEGLTAFSDAGYVLINPIYTPVNKLPDKEADQLILKNYPNFLHDVASIGVDKETPIILIKKNICTLLDSRMKSDGFNVLNQGESVPFPMHYHFQTFEEKILRLLKNT